MLWLEIKWRFCVQMYFSWLNLVVKQILLANIHFSLTVYANVSIWLLTIMMSLWQSFRHGSSAKKGGRGNTWKKEWRKASYSVFSSRRNGAASSVSVSHFHLSASTPTPPPEFLFTRRHPTWIQAFPLLPFGARLPGTVTNWLHREITIKGKWRRYNERKFYCNSWAVFECWNVSRRWYFWWEQSKLFVR